MTHRGIFGSKWQRLLLCLVLCVGLLAPLVPAGAVKASPGVTMSGRVYNVTNGAPLVGATVSTASRSATTSDTGEYTIADIPTGTYDVSASFSGFRTRAFNAMPFIEGQNITQNIALTPGNVEVASVRGFIVNSMSGAQLGGVRVSLTDDMVRHSDGSGWFEIGDVPVGYSFNITARAYSGYLPRTVNAVYAGEYWDLAITPELSERGSISGKVTNASTQAAVAGAIVRAGFGFMTRTDSNGDYTLDNLPPGSYYLQAHKSGFESATAQQNVAQGSTLTQDLPLTPSAVAGWVWGYVTNVLNGNRIDGATVTVGGKTVVTQRSPTYWWDNGWYEIYGVTPGNYTLTASKDGYVSRSSNALAVSFTAESRMDITLTPVGTPAMTLTGTVKNLIMGSAISQARVWVQDNIVVLASDNGTYTIPNLPTGRNYDLRASKDGYRGRAINGLPLNGTAGDTLTQNIALTPSSIEVASVRGFIVNSMSGAQLSGVKVSLTDDMVRHSDGSGWFSIDDVPVGYSFNITARAYSGYLPRSVSGVYADEYWDFAITPELSERGSISGRVTNASTQAAVAGAIVRAGFGFMTRTDSNGNYTLDNLPPGSYYLQAHKSGFESATAQQNVAQGSTLTQDLPLTPSAVAGWVWGYVTNVLNGNRIDGATVTVGGKTVVTQRSPTYWWDNGWYEIYGVTPGNYSLTASKDGYVSRSSNALAVSFTAESRMDITLTPVGTPAMTLTGTVKNLIMGSAISQARVWVQDNIVVLASDNGTYTIPNLPTGRTYDLRASKDGYRSRVINGLPLNGSAGDTFTQNIALTLSSIEVASVRGFVVNSMSNAQIGGVKVSLTDEMVRHSDGSGWYSIDDVPVGYAYSITARAYSGYLPRSVNGVYAGEYWDLAITPELSERGSISGKVTNATTQAAVAGAIVRAGFGFMTRTDSSGNYTLDNLPPGSYYLQAHKSGFESATAQQNVAQGSTLTQDLPMRPNPSVGWVWGYVTNASNGSRIDGATVTVGGKTVVTQRSPTYWWDNGWYEIYGITPGSYTGIASYPGYQAAQAAVTVSFQAETRRDFSLTPSTSPAPLAAIYQPASGAQLSGTVAIIGTATDTDFKQYKVEYEAATQPGVWNVIIANQTTPVNQGTLANWDTGPVAGGQYTLRLTAEDNGGNSSTATVVVQVVKTGATLTGTVTLQGVASDHSGVRISLASTAFFTYTGTNGAFSLGGVPAGTYTVVAAFPGYLPAQRQVTVPQEGSVALPAVTLLAGDVNRDGTVDVYDMTIEAANYGRTASPW